MPSRASSGNCHARDIIFIACDSDRRETVIYEITSPPIRFWGYRYADKITGKTVYLPASRVDSETVEIGRTIENDVFKPGARLSVNAIEAGARSHSAG